MQSDPNKKWDRLELESLASLLTTASAPWWVAGGLAIDLFLGRQTRPHEDLDIVINRDEQRMFIEILKDWDLRATDPPGSLSPLRGEVASLEANAIWCRESVDSPWRFEFLLSAFTSSEWIYRRNPRVRGSIDTFSWLTSDGFRVISPEIQLLYKSKARRPKDEVDFANCLAALSPKQITWLDEMLEIEHGASHPWLQQIRKL